MNWFKWTDPCGDRYFEAPSQREAWACAITFASGGEVTERLAKQLAECGLPAQVAEDEIPDDAERQEWGSLDEASEADLLMVQES